MTFPGSTVPQGSIIFIEHAYIIKNYIFRMKLWALLALHSVAPQGFGAVKSKTAKVEVKRNVSFGFRIHNDM